MSVKIYQTKKDVKGLTKKILLEDKESFGINAAVLTSMINKLYIEPEFLKKRSKITQDLANAQITGRINSEYIRIGIYLPNQTPIVFEYQGPLAKAIYDKLKNSSK